MLAVDQPNSSFVYVPTARLEASCTVWVIFRGAASVALFLIAMIANMTPVLARAQSVPSASPSGEQASHHSYRMARAHRHFKRARFREALSVLEEIEASGSLGRDMYAELLELHALASQAVGEETHASLLKLFALVPDHQLSSHAPPSLVTQWQAIQSAGEPLALRLSVLVRDGNITVVQAAAEGVAAELVDRVHVHARAQGITEWESGEGQVLIRGVPQSVEVYATATGLRGLLLGEQGTANEPTVLVPVNIDAEVVAQASNAAERVAVGRANRRLRQHEAQEERRRTRRRRGLGIASALILVGAAIALGIAFRPEPKYDPYSIERRGLMKPLSAVVCALALGIVSGCGQPPITTQLDYRPRRGSPAAGARGIL